MNKIKDFLYDISDLVLSLLIIGIIFMVVSWKLTDTMAISWFSNINDADIAELEFTDVTPPDISVLEPSTDEDAILVDDQTDASIADENEVIEIIEIKDRDFTISSGSSGYKIAKQLKDNNLITDVDEFLLTLDDLGHSSKLRSGTFKLNTGMNVVEIINKLTGQ